MSPSRSGTPSYDITDPSTWGFYGPKQPPSPWVDPVWPGAPGNPYATEEGSRNQGRRGPADGHAPTPAELNARKPDPPAVLYTYAKTKQAVLFEHGNYRLLQPGEVSAVEAYVKAFGTEFNAPTIVPADEAVWKDLLIKQQAPGSSNTTPTPTMLYLSPDGTQALLLENGTYRLLTASYIPEMTAYVNGRGGGTVETVAAARWDELMTASGHEQRKAGQVPNLLPGPPGMAAGPPTTGQWRDQLTGFDFAKLDDATHNTPKYVFAKYAQGYDVRDLEARKKLLAALQADPSGYFRHATLGGSKGDRLIIEGTLDPAFGDINEFDVILAAGEGGKGWAWQPAGGPGYKAPPSPSPPPSSPYQPPSNTPRDYGPPPVWTTPWNYSAQTEPYGPQPPSDPGALQRRTTQPGLSPEAYRQLVAQQQQPLSPVPFSGAPAPLSALSRPSRFLPLWGR